MSIFPGNSGAPRNGDATEDFNADAFIGNSLQVDSATNKAGDGPVDFPQGLTGDVDGRDVAADGAKLDLMSVTQEVDLDAIETNSDASKVVTDKLDVTAITSAVFNADGTITITIP